MIEREFHSQYLSLAEALYRVAFYILESEAEAEDAVQELYLKLWKNRSALDGIRSPKAYAMTLLRNICMDRIRQEKRISGAEVPESIGGGFDPEAAIDGKERLEKVLAAVKSLPDKQREIDVYERSEKSQLINHYIHGEERSFTIIAYPVPSIGEKYEEIFAETVHINTLDYMLYRNMQQKIIDVLDTADRVHIKGCNGNRTDLYVKIHPLSDPAKETAFENCVADVNIPVGEVFTTPVLEGTRGLLHVKGVYLNGLFFRDLEIRFENGRTVSGTCANFEKEEENRKLVKQVIFANHDSLPMGEFAVGTNTTAYAAALRYGIQDKFPILIAEKTGPHFAVGDTCYSWMEDVPVHNPDGREMIAKENEISRCRKTDPGKAYFNCHTDITIPYSELDTVEAVSADGTRTAIIAGGRFVLSGTEELNAPFLALEAEGVKG